MDMCIVAFGDKVSKKTSNNNQFITGLRVCMITFRLETILQVVIEFKYI